MLQEFFISELRDSVMCSPSAPAGYVLLAESLRKLVCSIESTFRLDSWLHYKSCVLLLACTRLYDYCYFCIGKRKIPSILCGESLPLFNLKSFIFTNIVKISHAQRALAHFSFSPCFHFHHVFICYMASHTEGSSLRLQEPTAEIPRIITPKVKKP